MPAQDEVLALGPRGACRLIREALLSAGFGPERTAAVDEHLDQVLAGVDGAWSETCRAIWADESLRAECDRFKGLRTVIRRVAAGSVMEAIAELLVQRCSGRLDDAQLIQAVDGAVWIPDMVFRDLGYHLELNDYGCGPGFDEDPDVQDLCAQPEGPQGLWRRWLQWAGEGEAPRRAFVAHPLFVGSFPASGVPSRSQRIRRLRETSRLALPNGPLLVLDQAALLPWTRERLGGLNGLVGRTRSPEERATIRFPMTTTSYRRASDLDPANALESLLSRTGEPTSQRALIEVLRLGLMTLLPLGTSTAAGVTEIQVPSRPRMARILVTRTTDRMLVNADGIGSLATWLGLFPYSYHPSGGSWTWTWSTLSYCGWHRLEASGAWARGRFDQEPMDGIGGSGWIALPGRAPLDLPSVGQRARVIQEAAPSICDMSLDAPWSPPDRDG